MADNPILQVLNAGHGATPACPQAKFQAGDVVRLRRRRRLLDLPQLACVAAVVPPGFPPEYALADAAGQPRPLMVSRASRSVTYIIGFEHDPRPRLMDEQDLIATGETGNVFWTEKGEGADGR